jgi:hypothetical protein
MLVAWRRVHRRKGMWAGGTAREKSRGAGAGGEDIGLGRHYKDDDEIEDWPLPERDRVWSWVDKEGVCVCGCRPSLTGE